ncbi:MAG: hypothetical protein WCO66_00435 [Candidatus Absconditabacteria bacterium]
MMTIDQIDKNQDKDILLPEIQDFVNNKIPNFPANEENIKLIIAEFTDKDITDIENSFKKNLLTAYEQIKVKIEKTPEDQKIVDVIQKLGIAPIEISENNEINNDYLSNIVDLLGGDQQNIKNILKTNLKNVCKMSNVDVINMDIDEKGVYIKQTTAKADGKVYILQLNTTQNTPQIVSNKEYLLYNIKLIVGDYISMFDRNNRQNVVSLSGMENNINYQKQILACYKDLLSVKNAFINGALDLSKYQKKYGKEQTDKALIYLLNTLVYKEKLISGQDALYAKWTLDSLVLKSIKNSANKKGTIYESLYLGYINYQIKPYLDIKTGYLKKDFFDNQAKYWNPKIAVILSTEYGKKLFDKSQVYYQSLIEQTRMTENKKVIADFEKGLADLEKQLQGPKQEYDRRRGTDQLSASGDNTVAVHREVSKKKYDEAIAKATLEGNRAFIKMIFQLNNVGLDNKLSTYFNALNGTEANHYKGPKKLPAPIGGADFMLDFSKWDIKKTPDQNADNIIRDSFFEKTGDKLQQMVDDIRKDPAKFLVDIIAIIGGGLAASLVGSTGVGMVGAGATFTAVNELIKGVGIGTLEVSRGGTFGKGFQKGVGYVEQNEQGEYKAKERSTFLTEKTFELGSGIILMGPVGKIGGMVEQSVVKNMIAESTGLGTKILSKSIGLMAEAGAFTGFGTVYDPLQKTVMDPNTSYLTELKKGMDPVNITSGFVYNIGFIGVLKVGGALSSPLSKSIIDKISNRQYDSFKMKFLEKSNEFGIKIKEKGITVQENGEQIRFTDKTGKEIDFSLPENQTTYKDILEIQNTMLTLQQQIIGVTVRLKTFNNIPDVNTFNEFCKKNNLSSEVLSPEIILKKRIESYKKKGNTTELEKWTKVAEEFVNLKSAYDKQLTSFGGEKTIIQDVISEEKGKEENTTKSEAKEAGMIEPERIFEMPEAEVKKIFDLQKESIEKDLANITPETTIEQKKIIAKKVERFTNQIKNILTYVKDNYESIKTLKGFDRIDYIVKLVEELWLNKGIEDLLQNGLDMLNLDDNMTVIALKGAIEAYKIIRLYYIEFKAMRGSGVFPETVRANAELSPEARITKAKELLGNLTPAQEKAILDAHNQSGEIYNLNFSEIRVRTEMLKKAGFTSEQVRILMENGICGSTISGKIEQVNKDITQKGEKSVEEFIEKHKNSDLTKYLGDLKKLYTDHLPEEIKIKLEKGETLNAKDIQEQQAYDIRFKSAVDYMSPESTLVRFKNATGERQNTNINEYGKSLISAEIYDTPEGQVFFNTIKEYMFYQTLDNPLQFCSHGFDHSILVDEYVKNISNGTDVVNKTMEKYAISPEAANLLLRLTAVFHDFGYPEVGKLDKSTHGPFGGVLFKNEIAPSFEKMLTKQFGVDQAKMGEIIQDMTDAIFFHSADKVEQGYLNKVKFTKGEFLVGEHVAEGQEKTTKTQEEETLKEVVKLMKGGDDFTIYYRAGNEGAKKNAESFQQQLVDLGVNKDHIKIVEDEVQTNYDKTHGQDQYQGRKSKSINDFGIEFKPIDLYSSPLSGVVRLADNFDMSLNRLTELQKSPVFMDMVYNVGMTTLGANSSSSIFQSIEKIVKMPDGPEKVQKITGLHKQIKNNGIELMVNDGNTGNIKEIQTIKLNDAEIGSIFKADGNIDINGYKLYLVDQLAKIHNVTDAAKLQGIKNVALEEKTGSYTFRHFVGLTPIQDVTLLKKPTKRTGIYETVIKVVVDEKVYNNSKLSNESVKEEVKEEDGTSHKIDIPLCDYHIWRLYDASARVTVDNTLLQVEIYNQEGKKIGRTQRQKASEGFKIISL